MIVTNFHNTQYELQNLNLLLAYRLGFHEIIVNQISLFLDLHFVLSRLHIRRNFNIILFFPFKKCELKNPNGKLFLTSKRSMKNILVRSFRH